MAATALRRTVAQLKALVASRQAAQPTVKLARWRADPSLLLADSGLSPDGWQRDLLRGDARRVLVLASRQAGKSSAGAALALRECLLRPCSLALLLSPTQRQSGELYRRLRALFDALGRPVAVRRETQLTLELYNGSRIVSLPDSEANVRCYSGVALLLVDEAARVSPDLLKACRPMLATSGGRLVALSTPFGRLGWLYEAWHAAAEPWHRVKVTAPQCPRIPAAFLEQERVALGDRWFKQEYLCEFSDLTGCAFDAEVVRAAVSAEVKPLLLGGRA